MQSETGNNKYNSHFLIFFPLTSFLPFIDDDDITRRPQTLKRRSHTLYMPSLTRKREKVSLSPRSESFRIVLLPLNVIVSLTPPPESCGKRVIPQLNVCFRVWQIKQYNPIYRSVPAFSQALTRPGNCINWLHKRHKRESHKIAVSIFLHCTS